MDIFWAIFDKLGDEICRSKNQMILDVDHLRIIMAPVRVIDTGKIKELFHCDTHVPTPEGMVHDLGIAANDS